MFPIVNKLFNWYVFSLDAEVTSAQRGHSPPSLVLLLVSAPQVLHFGAGGIGGLPKYLFFLGSARSSNRYLSFSYSKLLLATSTCTLAYLSSTISSTVILLL